MVELYSKAEAEAGLKRAKICLIAAGVSLAAGLIVCILLCQGVTTRNAPSRQLWTVCIAAASGWLAILLYMLGTRPAKAAGSHAAWMLSETPEAVAGEAQLMPGVMHIPHSIDIRKVRVRVGEDSVTLNLNAAKAARFPAGGRMTLYTVRKYIVGYEVGGDA